MLEKQYPKQKKLFVDLPSSTDLGTGNFHGLYFVVTCMNTFNINFTSQECDLQEVTFGKLKLYAHLSLSVRTCRSLLQ